MDAHEVVVLDGLHAVEGEGAERLVVPVPVDPLSLALEDDVECDGVIW